MFPNDCIQKDIKTHQLTQFRIEPNRIRPIFICLSLKLCIRFVDVVLQPEKIISREAFGDLFVPLLDPALGGLANVKHHI